MGFVIVSCETLTTPDVEQELEILSFGSSSGMRAGDDTEIKWINNTGRPVTMDLMQNGEYFLRVGTFAHMMTEYCWSIPEDIVPGQSYSLLLYVSDENSISAVTKTFSIAEKENLQPFVVITEPRDGKYVKKGSTVLIRSEAWDEDGDVIAVEYFINNEFFASITNGDYAFEWSSSSAEEGIYKIEAVAVDNKGERSEQYSINIVISDQEDFNELVRVPTGSFTMGSLSGDHDEKPANLVYITQDYYIGKFTVTNGDYAAILNYAMTQNEIAGDFVNNINVLNLHGSQRELVKLDVFEGGLKYDGTVFRAREGFGNRPVVWVSWWGAAFYSNMLSRKLNLEELYDLTDWTCDFSKTGYRMPTEAEWEYAATYNNNRIYPWGNTDPTSELCNYNSNPGHTTPVGSYSPQGDSGLGLADMAGNVWEWCNDWYGYYPRNEVFYIDPTGPPGGTSKVIRGGSYNSTDYYIRTKYRNSYRLYASRLNGMRIVLSIR